jgi:hypothetical protein
MYLQELISKKPYKKLRKANDPTGFEAVIQNYRSGAGSRRQLITIIHRIRIHNTSSNDLIIIHVYSLSASLSSVLEPYSFDMDPNPDQDPEL